MNNADFRHADSKRTSVLPRDRDLRLLENVASILHARGDISSKFEVSMRFRVGFIGPKGCRYKNRMIA